MKPILYALPLFLLSLLSCRSDQTSVSDLPPSKPVPYVESFRIDSCEEIALVYREYKDGATIEKELSCRITDPDVIARVLNLLGRLPDRGELFVSFVLVSYLEATVRREEETLQCFFFTTVCSKRQTPRSMAKRERKRGSYTVFS